VSSGYGVIDGFSSTVAAIISYLGFNSFVTASRDVAGIAQGIEEGADVLMLADDNKFVALAPASRLVVDNTVATARGFVAGLELMKGGITGESVLVLGCGPVGVHAAEALIDRGAGVVLCDKNRERAAAALEEVVQSTGGQVRLVDDSRTAIERYELIFDATNEGDFIEPSHLTSRAMVAAPGMPCALNAEALEKHRDRVIHDALEIGTATMAVQATAQLAVGEEVKKADR
jgi:pyrrolysine biosynthesis protein PylD